MIYRSISIELMLSSSFLKLKSFFIVQKIHLQYYIIYEKMINAKRPRFLFTHKRRLTENEFKYCYQVRYQ